MAEVKTSDRSRSTDTKRIGALEAGVSALAIALTANGITLPEGSDPIEEAIKAIKFFAEMAEGGPSKIAELDEQLYNLAGYASGTLGRLVPDLDLAPLTDERPLTYLERLTAAANPTIENLLSRASTPGTDAAELEELRKRVVELTAEVGELEQDLKDMTDAKNTLANRLADEGKGTAPAPAPEPAAEPEPEAPLERPAGARDIGPTFGNLTAAAIGRLVEDGGTFELAFSNGEFEVVDFDPVKLAAKDLTRIDSSRWIVEPAIHVRGYNGRVKVHGAGLIYNGEQVAYCTFEPTVYVDRGQERRFHRALIFG